jgi:hypothetical protein
MTIHRLMTAIASEQVHLRDDEPVTETTSQTTDDGNSVAAEQ